MDSSTVSTTFLHAITFLLSPLSPHYPAQVLDALHLALLSSFSNLDITSRVQSLLLSPTAPPPPSVFYALQTLQSFPSPLRVHWADWMLLLGRGNQLVLTIVAGSVQVVARDAATGLVTTSTVWNNSLQLRAPSPWGSSVRSRSSAPSSSDSSADSESSRASSPVDDDLVAVGAAENVLNGDDDEHDRVIFPGRVIGIAMSPVASKLSAAAPEWHPSTRVPMTPAAPAKMQPVGTKRTPYQLHSRSSSRSSTLSSAPSLISSHSSSSASTTMNSAALASHLASLSLRSKTPATLSSHSTGSSSASVPAAIVPPSPTPSDISDSVDATFYLDSSKDQQAVTEYECGKVGVLTGAVMLGVPKGPKAVKVVGGKGGVRRL